MNRKKLICIDRDGTLIYDSREHYFLGKDDDWQDKVIILPYVVEGLQLLRSIPDIAIYMITNQAGVAINDFPLLTRERAHEVCTYTVDLLNKNGAHVDGYFLCPHATLDYVSRKAGVDFDPGLVHDCQCLKPGLGMVLDALKAENISVKNTDIYVVGDRASDIQTALNIGGTGILIPFENEPDEEDKVRQLDNQANIYIAGDLHQAAKLIALK